MIHLTGFLICADEAEAKRVADALPAHLLLTRAEPGCVSFEVIQTADPLVWHVDERFADRDAFAAHRARASISLWATETAGIKRDYVITDDSNDAA